jgi:Tfp pilus assembly protein PilV
MKVIGSAALGARRTAMRRTGLPRHGSSGAHRQRGAGLVEALIALLVLMVSTLGIAGLQVSMAAQASTNGQRLQAQVLADEILSLALVDAQNASCYTLPAAGACASAPAAAAAQNWSERAHVALALNADPQIVLDADGSLTVRMAWRNKDGSRVHELETRTHVQP